MRALCLSGGSSHGAIELGALKYIIGELGVSYSILTGISVGAINVGYISMYPPEQDKLAIQNLEKLWRSLTTSSVRKNWLPFGILHALWLDSLYDSTPLINMIHNGLNLDTIRKNGRNVAVGAVSMTTGNYRTFTQNDDSFIDGVLASSSYPMGLKPIIIDGQKYTDGGTKHICAIQEAIDFGATDIDILCCGPTQTTSAFNDVNTITFGLRCFDFMTDQLLASDLKLVELYNQLVVAGLRPDKKLINVKVVRPTQDSTVSSLNFNPNEIAGMIDLGYQLAKEQYKV